MIFQIAYRNIAHQPKFADYTRRKLSLELKGLLEDSVTAYITLCGLSETQKMARCNLVGKNRISINAEYCDIDPLRCVDVICEQLAFKAKQYKKQKFVNTTKLSRYAPVRQPAPEKQAYDLI